MAQVVDPESHLEPVGGRSATSDEHARVVDEDGEIAPASFDRRREAPDRIERGEIQVHDLDRRPSRPGDTGGGPPACGGVAARDDHAGIAAGQCHRRCLADAGVAAGDQHRTALDRPSVHTVYSVRRASVGLTRAARMAG